MNMYNFWLGFEKRANPYKTLAKTVRHLSYKTPGDIHDANNIITMLDAHHILSPERKDAIYKRGINWVLQRKHLIQNTLDEFDPEMRRMRKIIDGVEGVPRGLKKTGSMWQNLKSKHLWKKLEGKLLQNRIRNLGVPYMRQVDFTPTEVGRKLDKTKNIYKKIKVLEELAKKKVNRKVVPSKKLYDMPAFGTPKTEFPLKFLNSDERIVVTKNLHKNKSMPGLFPPETRPAVTHHEIDEIEIARKNPQKSILKFLISMAKTKSPHGGYAGHISPEVLLRESNRVFGSSPKTQEAMKRARRITGEAVELGKKGLRYGDEYIPEGGRRWNKLVAKLTGKSPPAMRGFAKVTPSDRKILNKVLKGQGKSLDDLGASIREQLNSGNHKSVKIFKKNVDKK